MSNSLKGKRVVVTGGAGFLGRHVVERLKKEEPGEIVVPRSKQYDLRQWEACQQVTKNCDVLIHLAAQAGGIGLNREKPGELFFNNAIMGVQLIEAARLQGVGKVVVCGTICAYPNFTPVPFKEADLWNGYPEVTNAPYGIAKKALMVQLSAYRDQYGLNGIYLLPVNLYGPHDNFDLQTSHVIPALIRKIDAAIKKNESSVTLWGDGSASREFLYVEDAAEGIVLAARSYNSSDPVNLGAGQEILIRDLASAIGKTMGYKGSFNWDTTKPNGQPRRMLDTTRARERFGFTAQTSLEQGLQKTVQWFLNHSA